MPAEEVELGETPTPAAPFVDGTEAVEPVLIDETADQAALH
jgi:hypothetical protein